MPPFTISFRSAFLPERECGRKRPTRAARALARKHATVKIDEQLRNPCDCSALGSRQCERRPEDLTVHPSHAPAGRSKDRPLEPQRVPGEVNRVPLTASRDRQSSASICKN